jgi:hypothetical protein
MHFSKIFTCKYLVLFFLSLTMYISFVKASTYYSIASGNWTSSSSWSLTSGGTAISSGYPGVGDDVIIEGNHTITISNDGNAANNITIGSTTNGTLRYDDVNGPATLTISNDLTIGGSSGNGALHYNWSGLEIICKRLLKGNGSATRVNDYRQSFTFTGTFTLPSSFNVFESIKINGGNVTLSNNLQINGNTSPYIYAGSSLDLKTYSLNIDSWGVFSLYGTLIIGGPSNFPTGWTTLTIDPNSTVKYNYNGNKLIYPTTYGNLVIEGNGTYQANRFISSVTVTNGGSGYSMFDEWMGNLTFSGGGGSGASARFYRNFSFDGPFAGSSIRSVEITNAGSGYTSTPTVSLDGTTGSGATFIANLTNDTYSAITTSIIIPSPTPIFANPGPITICQNGSYFLAPSTLNGTFISSVPSVATVNPSGYVTAVSSSGTTDISLTTVDGTVTATVTVGTTSSLTITDPTAKPNYKFIINTPQGPVDTNNGVLNYVGYNGFIYSSQTKPTNTGFYRASKQDGNEAGCPVQFYIIKCDSCQ